MNRAIVICVKIMLVLKSHEGVGIMTKGERREYKQRKQRKMRVTGMSVRKLQNIIVERASK